MVTQRSAAIFRLLLLLFLASRLPAAGEDLKLADGSVLRDVRVLEVRPDALIVRHRDGVAMADFGKLPKSIRARYNYDARKATAYREREAATRRAIEEENRRLIDDYEKRKIAMIRSRIESSEGEIASVSGFSGGHLTYQPRGAERAFETAVSYISEEIAQREAARIAEARKPETFWNAPFWQHPAVAFIGALLGAGGGGAGGDGNSRERGGGFDSEPRGWR